MRLNYNSASIRIDTSKFVVKFNQFKFVVQFNHKFFPQFDHIMVEIGLILVWKTLNSISIVLKLLIVLQPIVVKWIWFLFYDWSNVVNHILWAINHKYNENIVVKCFFLSINLTKKKFGFCFGQSWKWLVESDKPRLG